MSNEIATCTRDYLHATAYQKSNTMITSLSSPTLLCNKLLMISTILAQPQQDGSFIAKVPGAVLRKIFANKSGSFYDRIYETTVDSNNSSSLMGYIAIYKDEENKTFSASRLITDANFDGNVLYLRYNSSMAKYIFNLKTNYTKFDIDQMMSLKSIYSWRLLELFQSNINLKDWENEKKHISKQDAYILKVDMTDLKLMLGIIDSSNKAVIKGIKSNNYDIIEQIDTNAKMARYGNFKRDVLDHAQKEIAEKSNIKYDYEPIRTGKGGKVTAIIFKIYHKNDDVVKEIPEIQYDEDDVIDCIREFIPADILKTKELRILIKDAAGDIEKIRKAWNIAEERGNITNIMGFMRKAIRDDYEASKPLVNNKFNNFENRRDYDFDELERTILTN